MSWRVARALGATAAEGLLGEVNRSAPHRATGSDGAIGDVRHRGWISDHNPCKCCAVVCARDFTNDPRGGFDADHFAEWLRRRVRDNPPERRVKYVIWRKRIFSGVGQAPHPVGMWRKYRGKNPHVRHVHVSVQHGADTYDDTSPWGWHPKVEGGIMTKRPEDESEHVPPDDPDADEHEEEEPKKETSAEAVPPFVGSPEPEPK